MSDKVREGIAVLIRRAAGIGMGVPFRDSVRSVLASLRDNPRNAGDPLRHLHGLSSILFRIVRDRLIVYYSVHERIPMVTVWQFEAGPDHPLSQ